MAKWFLDKRDDNGCRVLWHDDPRVSANMLPDDQERAKQAVDRAAFAAVITDILRVSQIDNPPRIDPADLDYLRARLKGEPFTAIPNVKRREDAVPDEDDDD